MVKLKIIFHIDEPNKWPMVLENLKNVLNNAKETNRKYELEVLANSMAVFPVCNNSLNKFNISKDELFSFCKVVPAGIIELAEKQSEGYLYIKP